VPVTRILVGVDGSEDSFAALDWAARLAVRLDAEVVAVHAIGLLEHLPRGDGAAPAAPHREEVELVFEQEWCAPLETHGARGRRLTADGPPAMVLLRLATEERADLIVVGSRGMGGFPALQLGSTSAQVVQHAPVPVTVIPRPPVDDAHGSRRE
jgi:nucleotide-binding universal stress UspA family protein